MRPALVTIIAIHVLVGCGPIYIALYDIPLVGVEENGHRIAGDHEITTHPRSKGHFSTFQYKKLTISIYPFYWTIYIGIINNTNYPVHINWEETFYVDPSGVRHRVIHKGIDPSLRFMPQPETAIAPGDTLYDEIYPVTFINYDEEDGWDYRSPIPDMDINSNKLSKDAGAFIGKKMGLVLTLETDGEKRHYNFTFEIKNVQVELFKEGLYVRR
jgi:hypothetical protein